MNIFDIGVNHLPQTITVPTQKVLWKIVARNNGTQNLTTGVTLQLTWSTPVIYHRTSDVTDTAGQTFGNGTAANTFLNRATDLWTVGGLAVGQEKTLIVETSLPSGTNLATALPLSLTKVITVTGITDTESDNNTSVDILLGPSLDIECAPSAAAVDGNGCKCSVAQNDTPCNYGVTEWRLVPGSFVNTIEANLNFDSATGEYTSYQIDPTKNSTFKYGIYCLKDGVEVSGPFIATETILAKFNKDSFNHIPYFIQGSELTPAEVLILQAQYPTVSNITDNCWYIIRNGDGLLTGGIAVDCNKEQDARTFFICTPDPCTVGPPSCVSCPQSYLPNDVYTDVMATLNHEPEVGDTIFLQHPTGHSFHKWNGSIWERSGCGCISYENANPYPTSVEVTGTTTKTVTITMSDGNNLTTTFTDLDTDTTYILDGTTTPGTLFLRDAVTNAIVSTVVLPAGGGADNWGTQVIEHAVGSASSGDGTSTSPLLVETCPNINLEVLPQTSGSTYLYTLHVSGISIGDPLWDQWVWETADKYEGAGTTQNTNPVWSTNQTGGITYNLSGDDTIVRVVLTNGDCIYYSNESGYQCPCCDRVWMQLYEAGQSPILYYSGIVGAQINTWIWQENNPVGFTWTDVQTGGTSYPGYGDGYLYRIKYVDTVGCTHYSNIALGFNV